MPASILLYIPVLVLLAAVILLPVAAGAEQPETAQALPATDRPAGEEAELIPFQPDLDADFIYQRHDRPDPFMPFLAIWTSEDEADELRGLRRYEPNQLQLTAVVTTRERPLAMVQDIEGFGHIIRPGSAIGRHGRVTAITANRVTIREALPGLTDDQEYRTIEMVLKKEGEELSQ